jgi:flagellar hook-length control protein FliK
MSQCLHLRWWPRRCRPRLRPRSRVLGCRLCQCLQCRRSRCQCLRARWRTLGCKLCKSLQCRRSGCPRLCLRARWRTLGCCLCLCPQWQISGYCLCRPFQRQISGMPAPKPAPLVADIETPAAIPAPSAVANRMPDAVAVRAAAGNELPAPPLAPALAMVATQLPAAVPATEPPSMLRNPAPLFVGPLEADELTVAGVDRNRPPVALAVEGRPDLTLASAADPGVPQHRTWAAASEPLPSSTPEARPTSYQPPTSSQAPGPEAANAPISTTDLKSGLHAVDPSAHTASHTADGGTQIEQTASPNALSSLPTTSGTVAPDPAPSIKEGTHAAQILPTVIMLAKSALGGEQMTVQLHPAELGMVQVRIERAASGAAHIELTADDPRTLQALQQDQSALHRALDGAGIPAAGRTLTFHAGQPPPVSTSSESSGAALGSGQHPSSGRGANGNPDAGRFAGGGRGSYSPWETTRKSGGRPSSANATAASATPRVYRAGLDITA